MTNKGNRKRAIIGVLKEEISANAIKISNILKEKHFLKKPYMLIRKKF